MGKFIFSLRLTPGEYKGAHNQAVRFRVEDGLAQAKVGRDSEVDGRKQA